MEMVDSNELPDNYSMKPQLGIFYYKLSENEVPVFNELLLGTTGSIILSRGHFNTYEFPVFLKKYLEQKNDKPVPVYGLL
jgi:hypothetical protein